MGRISEELLTTVRERIGNAAEPATEEVFAAAEMALGRALPEDLQQVYALADGGWGPGGGFMAIAKAVKNYKQLLAEPFGPLDQMWPAALFPMYEEDRVPVCYEMSSGRIIAWEADRIEYLDSEEDFESSFIEEAPSLEMLLSNWLEAETFEQMRERIWSETLAKMAARPISPVTGNPMQFEDPVEQAQAEIEFLSFSAEIRALYELPESGWKAEVWRRYGIDPPQ